MKPSRFLTGCLLCLSLLPALPVFAANEVVLSMDPTGFNRDNCLNLQSRELAYSIDTTRVTSTDFRLGIFLVKDTTCPTTLPTSNKLAENLTAPVGTVSVAADAVARLATEKAASESPCAEDFEEVKVLACAYVLSPNNTNNNNTNNTANQSFLGTGSIELAYDSKAPAAPRLRDVAGGEGSIRVRWEGTADSWIITHRETGVVFGGSSDPCAGGTVPAPIVDAGEADAGVDAGVDAGEDAGAAPDASADPDAGAEGDVGEPEPARQEVTVEDETAKEHTLRGLKDGVEYAIGIKAIDSAGNQSDLSEELTAVPQSAHDFYERLRCAGIDEQGGCGCGTGSAAAIPALAFAAAALLGRRRRS